MIALLTRLLAVPNRRHVTLILGIVAVVILAGAGAFAATQGLPYTTGLYWAITTATTVGYGDVTPHNPAGRAVASVVMLTAIPGLAAVFALVTGGAVAAGVRRILAMETRFPRGAFRLVVGTNPMMPAILEELTRAELPVVLVADLDPKAVHHGVHLIRGDPTEVATIRAARPADAEQALVTGKSDGDVLVSTVMLRREAPDLTVSALVDSPAVREALQEVGVAQTLSAHDLIAHTMAKSLEAPHAGELLAQLVDSEDHCLAEVDAEPDTIGKRLSAVRDERSGLVLGLVHAGALTLGIGEDPVVAAGDRLLVAEPVPSR